MPKVLAKEGISFEALGLLLLVIAIPIAYVKWFDVTLLQPKKVDPNFQIEYEKITTITAAPSTMPGGIGINVQASTITVTPTIQPTIKVTDTLVSIPTVEETSKGFNLLPFGSWPGTRPLKHAIMIKLSWYWPPNGGINCDPESRCDTMANGVSWKNQVGTVCACPVMMPFGTEITFNGFTFTCADRGGAIVLNEDGSYWIDVLYPGLPSGYHWGDLIQAWTDWQ